MFGRLGPWEIGLILVIVLIIFGAGRLPQVGNSIGKAFRSFRHAQQGLDEEKEETEEAKAKKRTVKKAVQTSTK